MKKSFLWFILVGYVVAEILNQFYLRDKYSIAKSFEWNKYAYERNKEDINGLCQSLIASKVNQFGYEDSNYDTESLYKLDKQYREQILKYINQLRNDLQPGGRIFISFYQVDKNNSSFFVNDYCEMPNGNGCHCEREENIGGELGIKYIMKITTSTMWEKGYNEPRFHMISFFPSCSNTICNELDVSKCYHKLSDDTWIKKSSLDSWIVMYNKNRPALLLYIFTQSVLIPMCSRVQVVDRRMGTI